VKGVAILGCTGHIGLRCLHLIEQQSQHFQLKLATGHRNIAKLQTIAERFPQAKIVCSHADSKLHTVQRDNLYFGEHIICDLLQASDIDIVIAAISGFAGLQTLLVAVASGKTVLIANKEALVCGGELLLQTTQKFDATILPIDSEHNAMFQCLSLQQQKQIAKGKGCNSSEIDRFWLTASGGPFFGKKTEFLETVTPEQACQHPTWKMGQKISIDSATMMNKGLEVIEACILFGIEPNLIQVVIHPSSHIHSLVAFKDGSTLAQMSQNDMAIPIHYAMHWPHRMPITMDALQQHTLPNLQFFAVDNELYPSLQLAIDCFNAGAHYRIALNAANEVAVESFLQNKIGFRQIATLCQKAVEKVEQVDIYQIQAIEYLHRQITAKTRQLIV